MRKPKTVTQKVLFIWGIIILLWSYYRIVFQTTLPIWFDEWIAKPIVFLIPVFLYITRTEHQSFLKGVGLNGHDMFAKMKWGIIVGLCFFGIGIISHVRSSTPFQISAFTVISFIGISLATTVTEETVSRGFVLQRLLQETKSPVIAIFNATLLHIFLRIPILFSVSNLTGVTIMTIMGADILMSIIVSLLFLKRKSLYPVLAARFFYTLTLYLFFI